MKINILLVEDDLPIQVVMRRMIWEMNLPTVNRIFEASNGLQPSRWMRNKLADLMLMDINMPLMDDLEMLAYIRVPPDYKAVSTVVVTTENNDRLLHLISGSEFGYVYKTSTPETIEQQIIKKGNVTHGHTLPG